MVKFDDAVEIITEAEEDNDDNTAVAELTGGRANEGETRLPVSLNSKEEVSGVPVGGSDTNSLLGGGTPFVTSGTKLSPFL